MSEVENGNRGASGRLDFIAGGVFLALSLIALIWAIPAFVDTPANTTQLSARFFPYLTASVVAVSSAALMAANRHMVRLPTGGLGVLIVGEAVVWGLCAVAVIAALRWFGFVPTGIGLTLLATLVSRHRGNWIAAVLIAVLLPIAVDQLVWHVFMIELP